MGNPCLYSRLISRNLNLCYVLSTISNMVKISRDDNYIVVKKETVFWGGDIYKYSELMCHDTYNCVFQCVFVWGE